MSCKNTILQEYAKELRKNPTESEEKMWEVLCGNKIKNVHFRRQHPIDPYVVDFCAPRIKLIIEIDNDTNSEQTEYEKFRTTYLEEKGYKILHFWNKEVIDNLHNIVQDIEQVVSE
ncbi:MAG: endonuclease domain-containing protein, partial [Candidatus Moranbacteria bacterium]|nr:endonuclease domain-containing protein [Candidatus Moranbacteria bacterium]